jgi:hypothetical protein
VPGTASNAIRLGPGLSFFAGSWCSAGGVWLLALQAAAAAVLAACLGQAL